MAKEKNSKINKENKKETKVTKKKVQNKVERKKIVIFASVILVILLLFVGLFFMFTKSDKKEQNKNQNEKHNSESSKIIKITDTNGTGFDPYNLVYSLNLNTLPKEYFAYFFKEDSITKDNMENKVKIFLAIRKLILENEEKYGDVTKEIHVSTEAVSKALKIIFGEDVTFTHESLMGNACTFTGFSYDSEKKEYVQKPSDDCGVNQDLIIYSEQENATVTENVLEVPISVVYVETVINPESTDVSYNYYQDVNKQTLLTTNNQYNTDAIKDKLQKYKFKFSLVNDTYQFGEVEKVQ